MRTVFPAWLRAQPLSAYGLGDHGNIVWVKYDIQLNIACNLFFQKLDEIRVTRRAEETLDRGILMLAEMSDFDVGE